MHTRSELRHACFRAKNNAATDKNRELMALVEPLLEVHQKWSNFATEWDLLVNKNNEIVIIKPEVDHDYIHSTCIEKRLYEKTGTQVEMDPRQENIVTIIEANMLDGLMTWENYGKVWSVYIDNTLKVIKTKLLNIPSNQLEVTDEMIEASKKDADGSAFTEQEQPAPLEATPMSPEQAKAFEEFLAKKNKDNQ